MTESALWYENVVDQLGSAATPAYVYDLAIVRENHTHLRAALPERAALYYSLKANPHPAVLGELRRSGALPEVCSEGELDASLAAGWSASEVLYTGPGKRDTEIARAIRLGVREFSVDSVSALDQLDSIAAEQGIEVGCLVRINDDQPTSGQGLAMTGVASQFGADLDQVLAEPARFAGRPNARVHGLHLYMGTNLTSVDDLVAQFRHSVRTAVRLVAALGRCGADIDVLDLGGGFGAPFAKPGERISLEGLRDELDVLLDEELPDPAPRVCFESGRYLVGTAGALVTRVLDVKQSHGRDVVVLESGINHLGGMAGLRRVPPLLPGVAGSGEGPGMTAMLTGPLCTPLDMWARNAVIPEVKPGQVLTVPNVGAYGLYASLLAFLGHPMPWEVIVDSDEPNRPPQSSRLELSRTHLEV
ncbi:type III PLP-dependent enzyme domain-containing protein [Saccharopolyspora tripterygii]